MRIEIKDGQPASAEVDLHCLGLFEGESLPKAYAGAPGAADAIGELKELHLLRPAGARILVVGLGPEADADAERLRVAAALATDYSKRYEARSISWEPPATAGAAAAIVEGTILASYSFDRLKSEPDPEAGGIEHLILYGVAGEREVEIARCSALAANRARDLQNLPANIANPAYLVERAREIADAHDGLELEVLGPAEQEALGMGGLISVGAGSDLDPALIVLRREGSGERLALVGKAVTFDTGGISLKRSQKMHEMKMDMSGGAAVLEATAAICELGIEIDLLTAIPAVENMPSGGATRPGDVITQMNGRTVEVNNTDAEGRLILADALIWCAREGAKRMIDAATLTGAVTSALGSTHAAVVGTDPELIETLLAAGTSTGELLWELPLHSEYRKLMDGTVADLTNSSPKPKAGTITAAEFLREFVEGVGWAHLDIAGSAWDLERAYAAKGPSGYGVRLLVATALALAAA